MTPDQMRAAYEKHMAAVNDHDLEAVMATFHPECYLEDHAFGLKVSGTEAVERYYERLFSMFSDAKLLVESWAFGDDVVVAWGTYRVTIPGLFLGVSGNVGPMEMTSGATIATFREDLIEGERIFLNLGSICDDVGVSIDQVRGAVRSLMG
jgi:steroid delta-isomerase-like uncharacterized protein